jgi:pyruvate/2-oxoglutarate dehydrogenase complex dihydrolipoamide acyltransferase (E2) component
MYEVTMPKMGMAMEDGEIVDWHIEEGTYIHEGDLVLTIMTDKATVEIESPINGLLLEIRAHAGEIIPIGEIIAIVDLDAKPS